MAYERDEALEDERNEHRLAVAQMNRESHIPFATKTHVPRFFKGVDEFDGAYDVIYVDRTTGREVMRYDGADPANTNPAYGAESDGSCMAKKGYEIGEMILREAVVISDEELRKLCRPPPYDPFFDDVWDGDEDDDLIDESLWNEED